MHDILAFSWKPKKLHQRVLSIYAGTFSNIIFSNLTFWLLYFGYICIYKLNLQTELFRLLRTYQCSSDVVCKPRSIQRMNKFHSEKPVAQIISCLAKILISLLVNQHDAFGFGTLLKTENT